MTEELRFNVSWTPNDNELAAEAGWGLFECYGQADGIPYMILRDDDAEFFSDDIAAFLHVWRLTRAGCNHARRALLIDLRAQVNAAPTPRTYREAVERLVDACVAHNFTPILTDPDNDPRFIPERESLITEILATNDAMLHAYKTTDQNTWLSLTHVNDPSEAVVNHSDNDATLTILKDAGLTP